MSTLTERKNKVESMKNNKDRIKESLESSKDARIDNLDYYSEDIEKVLDDDLEDEDISDEETAQYEEDMYELNYLLDKSRSSGLDRRELRNLQDLIDIYGYPEDRNYIEGLDEEDYYNGEDYDSLSESSKFKTIKVKFYTYAASYFVNGDSSGLSDEDLEECDFFEDLFKKEFKTEYFDCVDALDDEDFGYPELPLGYSLRENTKGHEFLRGDVCTYVFMI